MGLAGAEQSRSRAGARKQPGPGAVRPATQAQAQAPARHGLHPTVGRARGSVPSSKDHLISTSPAVPNAGLCGALALALTSGLPMIRQGNRVLVPAGRPNARLARDAARAAAVAQQQTRSHHPDFTQTRGWKAVQAEKLLPKDGLNAEIARGLELGLPGASSVEDRTIPTFSRGELPHFAGINTFMVSARAPPQQSACHTPLPPAPTRAGHELAYAWAAFAAGRGLSPLPMCRCVARAESALPRGLAAGWQLRRHSPWRAV